MKKPWVLSYPLSAPGWSESSLGAHSFCWFCHVVAQLFFSLSVTRKLLSDMQEKTIIIGTYKIEIHILPEARKGKIPHASWMAFIKQILSHLAYIVNGKKSCSNLQQFTGRKCVTLFSAVLWRHPSHRPCLLDVRRCNVVFARYKRKKYMQTLAIQSKLWRDCFQCNGGKLKESEG